MATKQKLLTAVFRRRADAVRAYEWLQHLGYHINEINVLMSDRTRTEFKNDETEGPIKSSSMLSEGVATGGAIGTAVGATLAAMLVPAAAMAFPGLGLVVAGPLIAGLAGGGAGAVGGGVIGGLIGMGIAEPNAKAYEEALRTGGVIFGVRPHHAEDAEAIKNYFEEQKADNIVFA